VEVVEDRFDRQKAYILGTLMHLLPFLQEEGSEIPLSVNDIDQELLDQALYCAIIRQKQLGYKDEKLGVINPDLPEHLVGAGLISGSVVLYSEDLNGKFDVHFPYSKEAIRQNRERGSLATGSDMLNVPRYLIRPLGKGTK
jgi:hypothetical protein